MGIKEDEAKLANWVQTGNDKIDAAVDGQVDKLKESRFTWLILGGCAVAALIIVGLLVAF